MRCASVGSPMPKISVPPAPGSRQSSLAQISRFPRLSAPGKKSQKIVNSKKKTQQVIQNNKKSQKITKKSQKITKNNKKSQKVIKK